jgi:carbon starvation protein
MRELTDYWYHFVIMFEALFILTLLETGTRVARFIFQESLAMVSPKFAPGNSGQSSALRWGLNIGMSMLVCYLWGYLLYTGNISSLWRMMGIANQLLATIALAVGTTYLLRYAPKRVHALCTGVPLVFVVATVFTAGVQSIRSWWGELALPDIDPSVASSVRLMCILASIMLVLSALVILDSLRRWVMILREPRAEFSALSSPLAE